MCNLSPTWTQALIANKLSRSDGACAHILSAWDSKISGIFSRGFNQGSLQLIRCKQKSHQQWGSKTPILKESPIFVISNTCVGDLQNDKNKGEISLLLLFQSQKNCEKLEFFFQQVCFLISWHEYVQ